MTGELLVKPVDAWALDAESKLIATWPSSLSASSSSRPSSSQRPPHLSRRETRATSLELTMSTVPPGPFAPSTRRPTTSGAVSPEAWGFAPASAEPLPLPAGGSGNSGANDEQQEAARLRSEVLELQRTLHQTQLAFVSNVRGRGGHRQVSGAQFRMGGKGGGGGGGNHDKCPECAARRAQQRRSRADEEEGSAALRAQLVDAETALASTRAALDETARRLSACEVEAAEMRVVRGQLGEHERRVQALSEELTAERERAAAAEPSAGQKQSSVSSSGAERRVREVQEEAAACLEALHGELEGARASALAAETRAAAAAAEVEELRREGASSRERAHQAEAQLAEAHREKASLACELEAAGRRAEERQRAAAEAAEAAEVARLGLAKRLEHAEAAAQAAAANNASAAALSGNERRRTAELEAACAAQAVALEDSGRRAVFSAEESARAAAHLTALRAVLSEIEAEVEASTRAAAAAARERDELAGCMRADQDRMHATCAVLTRSLECADVELGQTASSAASAAAAAADHLAAIEGARTAADASAKDSAKEARESLERAEKALRTSEASAASAVEEAGAARREAAGLRKQLAEAQAKSADAAAAAGFQATSMRERHRRARAQPESKREAEVEAAARAAEELTAAARAAEAEAEGLREQLATAERAAQQHHLQSSSAAHNTDAVELRTRTGEPQQHAGHKSERERLEEQLQSSVRLCVVAPTVNVSFGGQTLGYRAPLPKEQIKSTLELQVLPNFVRSFVQESEESSPTDGVPMEDWLKEITVTMQGSIERHLTRVFREDGGIP
jgi:hypothetical protein